MFLAQGCPSSLHTVSLCAVQRGEGCQGFPGGVPGDTNATKDWSCALQASVTSVVSLNPLYSGASGLKQG